MQWQLYVPPAATFENFTLYPRYIVRVPVILKTSFFSHGKTAPCGPGPPHYRGFTITLRHTTLGRTPLEEWSARRRDLYLTTHSTHKGQTSMPAAGFECAIQANERPHTCVATGIGWFSQYRATISVYSLYNRERCVVCEVLTESLHIM